MPSLHATRAFLRDRLQPRQWRRLRRAYLTCRRIVCDDSLPVLADLCGTDKWNQHWYARHYEQHLRARRSDAINILEIGVGGYADPESGGSSLRMWKNYFPHGRIFGIDVHDKSPHVEPRITIFRGSQNDAAFLRKVASTVGRLDVVVDDGSHVCSDVVTSFEVLFPLLANGGLYAIEDVQTSYWPGTWGGNADLACPTTTMNYFKRLTDSLNYEEFPDPTYVPTYIDRHVVAVHFYHNLVIVLKGDNAEGSNRAVAMADDRPPAGSVV